MNYSVKSGIRSGEVIIPASKSFAHRLLICACLASNPTLVECDGVSKDIDATINCLSALGAKIEKNDNKTFLVTPIKAIPEDTVHLYCAESGSTLRFLIPLVGALGANAVFHMEGRLSERPLSPLINTLEKNSMTIYKEGTKLYCSGKLNAGKYSIPGNISSQFISGLLFALPILDGESTLEITEKIESADYIKMTENAIKSMSVAFEKNDNRYFIAGNQKYISDGICTVERDWSNAAFFMCMGAFSNKGITLREMNLKSSQGDKEIVDILRAFGAKIKLDGNDITVCASALHGIEADASAIPDLVPTIAALACAAEGKTVIYNAARLRLKESDRLSTTADMLNALGANVTQTDDGLVIIGKKRLKGGIAYAHNDHRIAMAAAVASCVCENRVEVIGAECVAKSYPDFWDHLEKLEVSL